MAQVFETLIFVFVMCAASCALAKPLALQRGNISQAQVPTQATPRSGRGCQRPAVTVGAGVVFEGFENFVGGLSTAHPLGASTSDLNVTISTEELLGLQGGEFYADLEDHSGQNPTTALVGDLQVFDKLNSSPYFQLFEIWYQQKLSADKLRLKIGKVDANTEFSVIDYGLPFINSSTQVSPTIFVFPTTPDPMPSVNLFLTPNESYYVSLGACDANRSVTFGNFTGRPQNAQPTDNGVFLIGETGLLWRHTRVLAGKGNLKLGVWAHTGTFTRFDGSDQQGADGYYAIFNQTLWQPAKEPENGRGVRAFLEYGHTDKDVSSIDWHVGGGVTWTGPLAARPTDIVGLSPQYAHISSQAGLPQP